MTVEVGRADEIAAGFAARGGQPGLAYGLVAGGELVHAGGIGAAFTGGPVPQADTVFRIASMTKSFTASAIMALREDGVLRLDDPAHLYLPGLRGLRLPAADCLPVTIRQLLTMTAGFPTDDPWGDRQQGLPLDDFDALIAGGGVRYCWAPGTRFEYSNLGYALLGRIIATVTGSAYEDAIREMLLDAARPGPHRIRGRGVRRGQPGPRLPAGRGRLAGAGARPLRRVRADGRRLQLRPRPGPLGRRVRGRVPGRARAAGAASAVPGVPAGDAARSGRHPGGRRHRESASPGRPSISYGFGLFAEDDPAYGTSSSTAAVIPVSAARCAGTRRPALGAIVLANSTYAAAGRAGQQLLAGAARTELPASKARRPPGLRGRSRWPTAAGPRAVAGDPGGQDAVDAPAAGLGRRGRRAAVHRERRPGPSAGPAPRRHSAAARADRRVPAGSGPPARVRLARALPLVADRPARHGGRADQAGPARGAAGAAAGPGRAAGAGPRSAGTLAAAPRDHQRGRTCMAQGLAVAAGADTALRQLRLAAAWAGQCQPGWLPGRGRQQRRRRSSSGPDRRRPRSPSRCPDPAGTSARSR